MRASSDHSRTILVVEDEVLMRRLLKRSLCTEDTWVLLAADGQEAVDIYRDHMWEISVVLLDLGLPKISGWEVFKNLKQQNPDVCVVVASGYLDPDVKSRMHDAGVQYFIEKPYKLDQLMATLHGVINNGCERPNS
ncbi:MAG TPA: response regulator [Candidatus Polarisedimenticolaceae bacterium]|nr:response regulator [Candidatus Polarisedimenticolaceae bacterium]